MSRQINIQNGAMLFIMGAAVAVLLLLASKACAQNRHSIGYDMNHTDVEVQDYFRSIEYSDWTETSYKAPIFSTSYGPQIAMGDMVDDTVLVRYNVSEQGGSFVVNSWSMTGEPRVVLDFYMWFWDTSMQMVFKDGVISRRRYGEELITLSYLSKSKQLKLLVTKAR